MKLLKYAVIPFVLISALSASNTALANEHRTLKLGTHNLPNELRGHCPKPFSHCRAETRTLKRKVWIDVTYPSSRTIARHLGQCAAVAAGAGLLSAGSAIGAAFEGCMRSRAGDIANRIDFKVNKKNYRGPWTGH